MKLLYLFCFSLFVLSCNTNSTNQKKEINPVKEESQLVTETTSTKDTLSHKPQSYFEFDNVIHYNSGVNKGIAIEFHDLKGKNKFISF